MEPLLGGLSLIDLVVVAGVALVLPAALGGPRRWWWGAAAAVAVACAFERGTVAAIVPSLVWPVVGVVATARFAIERGPHVRWTRSDDVALLALGYSLVAAVWMVLSRAGATPTGIGEPIVQLTAVHFTYAGAAALVLADTALRSARTPGGRRIGGAAVLLTAAAPPVVAAGFVTAHAVAQIGGALLMTAGVFATATLHLRQAAAPSVTSRRRALLLVSGLSVWIPMGLAVAWAAAQHLDVPALSIPDMVRTHGLLNAVGFVGAGLAARELPSPAPVPTWR